MTGEAPSSLAPDAYVDEATRLLSAAGAAGTLLRASGGVAIRMTCPSAQRPPLLRQYHDIDFVARSADGDALSSFFTSHGYSAEEEFNALHGQRRLCFRGPEGRWEVDVFLDRIEMCHTLDVRPRLDAVEMTLTMADLLLSKLQVVETNEKDLQDILAILADHDVTNSDEGVNRLTIVGVCRGDWGWWRTSTMVAERARMAAQRYIPGANETAQAALKRAERRLSGLIEDINVAPKSHKWKLRARIGDRARWHETPEDIDHIMGEYE